MTFPSVIKNRARQTEERRTGKIHFDYRRSIFAAAIAADAARLLAEVPPDTRGLTAKLAGDPLPGRSALDKRQSR